MRCSSRQAKRLAELTCSILPVPRVLLAGDNSVERVLQDSWSASETNGLASGMLWLCGRCVSSDCEVYFATFPEVRNFHPGSRNQVQKTPKKNPTASQLLDHLPAALAAEPPSTSLAALVCWSLSVAFSAFDKTHGAGGPLNNRSVGLTGPL